MTYPNILTLDAGGIPMQWVDYEKAAFYIAKELVVWSLGSSITLHGGIQRLTGNQSLMDVKSILAIKGMGKSEAKHKVPALTNKALFARDRHTCAYCGTTFYATVLTRDHVVPVSRGGKNRWSNVVTACKPCNTRKDDKLLEKCGMHLLYVPYTPNNAEHLILSNRRILTDQMDYLRSCVPKNSRILAA